MLAEWITLATGIGWTVEELFKCGERIFNMKRLFNIRCGINRKDDTLPERILKETRGSGGSAENLPPLNEMLDEYYNYRGWNNYGIPNKEKLEKLNIYSLKIDMNVIKIFNYIFMLILAFAHENIL